MAQFDLRSDTVTKPSLEMRQAMARAEVGDDVYGEDPTVIRLEEWTAELLGKERALFVPSGTMGNQLALKLLSRPGDEVVIGEGAHVAWYEAGAGAALSGVQFVVAGAGGLFDDVELEAVIKPRADYSPRTSVVALENTHNRSGGRVFPLPAMARIMTRAQAHGLLCHLDGARIWNAAIASGMRPAKIAAGFDTVSVCFSKGLGAPVGSALAASSERILEARRYRRMLGGAMRQSGVLAAAALYALEHNRERLAEDHRNARILAEIAGAAPGATVDLQTVETNIVNIRFESDIAQAVAMAAKGFGVLLSATGPRTVRAVTHLDLSAAEVKTSAELLAGAIAQVSSVAR
ncbi:MAG TPA: GntG family PLP-dependent aldolase [Polyangiaceae bacterium]|jgi:threonine aldolase